MNRIEGREKGKGMWSTPTAEEAPRRYRGYSRLGHHGRVDPGHGEHSRADHSEDVLAAEP